MQNLETETFSRSACLFQVERRWSFSGSTVGGADQRLGGRPRKYQDNPAALSDHRRVAGTA